MLFLCSVILIQPQSATANYYASEQTCDSNTCSRITPVAGVRVISWIVLVPGKKARNQVRMTPRSRLCRTLGAVCFSASRRKPRTLTRELATPEQDGRAYVRHALQ